MTQSLRSYGPEPGPRPSLQLEIPCGGWREHTGESLPTQCPIIHKGQSPPTKSSGIRCWRDTVLVLSAFDTVFPPLCVFDAPGWQERYGRPVRTSLGTSHGYPAATITPRVSEFRTLIILLLSTKHSEDSSVFPNLCALLMLLFFT